MAKGAPRFLWIFLAFFSFCAFSQPISERLVSAFRLVEQDKQQGLSGPQLTITHVMERIFEQLGLQGPYRIDDEFREALLANPTFKAMGFKEADYTNFTNNPANRAHLPVYETPGENKDLIPLGVRDRILDYRYENWAHRPRRHDEHSPRPTYKDLFDTIIAIFARAELSFDQARVKAVAHYLGLNYNHQRVFENYLTEQGLFAQLDRSDFVICRKCVGGSEFIQELQERGLKEGTDYTAGFCMAGCRFGPLADGTTFRFKGVVLTGGESCRDLLSDGSLTEAAPLPKTFAAKVLNETF